MIAMRSTRQLSACAANKPSISLTRSIVPRTSVFAKSRSGSVSGGSASCAGQ